MLYTIVPRYRYVHSQHYPGNLWAVSFYKKEDLRSTVKILPSHRTQFLSFAFWLEPYILSFRGAKTFLKLWESLRFPQLTGSNTKIIIQKFKGLFYKDYVSKVFSVCKLFRYRTFKFAWDTWTPKPPTPQKDKSGLNKVIREYKSGDRVIGYNDPVYYLRKINRGIVGIYDETQTNLLELFTDGDYCGYQEFIGGNNPSLYNAIALNKVEVELICNADYVIPAEFLHRRTQRLRQLTNIYRSDNLAKVVKGLIYLVDAEFFHLENNQVEIDLGLDSLASLFNMPRESLSRKIGGLKKRNICDTKYKKLLVQDFTGLTTLLEKLD